MTELRTLPPKKKKNTSLTKASSVPVKIQRNIILRFVVYKVECIAHTSAKISTLSSCLFYIREVEKSWTRECWVNFVPTFGGGADHPSLNPPLHRRTISPNVYRISPRNCGFGSILLNISITPTDLLVIFTICRRCRILITGY